MKLQGQTILVTGASMGIGECLARELAAQGAQLILTARSVDRLEKLASELPTPARCIPCDFSEPREVAALAAQVKRGDKLDGIVHNAGIGLYGEFEQLSETGIRRLFEVNFFSILSLTRELLPLLKQSANPRIMTVSSVVAWRSIPRLSPYCASKGALNLFVEALRCEVEEQGISVTNAYPGRTATGFSQNAESTGWRPFSTDRGGTAPEKVARRLARAFIKGKRDEFVSLSNRALIYLNFFCPRLVDWGLKRLMRNR